VWMSHVIFCGKVSVPEIVRDIMTIEKQSFMTSPTRSTCRHGSAPGVSNRHCRPRKDVRAYRRRAHVLFEHTYAYSPARDRTMDPNTRNMDPNTRNQCR
jgi:hypothetical protein